MNTKRMSLTAVAAVIVLGVTACSGTPESPGEEPAAGIAPGVVTDIGGLGDRGFNDLAAEGLELAEAELGITGKVLVPATPADYGSNLSQLAENGSAPIFGIGFTYFDAITAAAAQYPDSHFGIIDSVVDAPNVASLVFREEEGSYLAGIVAGLMTLEDTEYTSAAEKVVGFIGGQDSPLIEKFGAGFKQGVLSVCADCDVLFQYVGTTTTAFNDPTTASEIAKNMEASGADVIYHAAGASGDGLFKAAQDGSFFAIGVNVDQALTTPDAPILTSVLKRVDTAVYSVIVAEAAGEFAAGVQSFGLADDGIALASFGQFEELVPADVQSAVDDARAAIIAGDIVVVTTLAELG